MDKFLATYGSESKYFETEGKLITSEEEVQQRIDAYLDELGPAVKAVAKVTFSAKMWHLLLLLMIIGQIKSGLMYNCPSSIGRAGFRVCYIMKSDHIFWEGLMKYSKCGMIRGKSMDLKVLSCRRKVQDVLIWCLNKQKILTNLLSYLNLLSIIICVAKPVRCLFHSYSRI